jgi:hypothetical protein
VFGGAELGYAIRCRAPGTTPAGSFVRLLGAGALLHLGAVMIPPVRAALGLPSIVTPLELAGFAAGLAAPLVGRRSASDEIIVRRGRAATARLIPPRPYRITVATAPGTPPRRQIGGSS